jgi:hypothetical protein
MFPKVPNLENQCMEMIADNEATWHSVIRLSILVRNADQQPEASRVFVSDATQAFRTWLFAIFTLARIFGDEPLPPPSLLPATTHPPFRFRQRMIVDAVAEMAVCPPIDGLFGDKAAVAESINRTLTAAEDAIGVLTGEPESHLGLLEREPVHRFKAELIALWESKVKKSVTSLGYVWVDV